jgi:hypothetical protein
VEEKGGPPQKKEEKGGDWGSEETAGRGLVGGGDGGITAIFLSRTEKT